MQLLTKSTGLAALKEYVGGISRVSKGEANGKHTAWYSYGLPTSSCGIGGRLQDVKGSVCEHCYADGRGNYRFNNVKLSQQRKLEAITKPHWVQAMVRLIEHYSPDFFRWHDSGDLQSLAHLDRIVQIAKALPNTKFWLPTREVNMVREYLTNGGKFPPNLCVRLSAIMVDTKPPKYSLPVVLPTSTVHTAEHRGEKGKSIVCGAPKRNGACGPCRACWSTKVGNVSYGAH